MSEYLKYTGSSSLMTHGKIYKVIRYDGNDPVVINEKGNERTIYSTYMRPASKSEVSRSLGEAMKPTLKKDNQYTFEVGAYKMINELEIYAELSYKNPLALLEVNGDVFVSIHDSIWAKADCSVDGSDISLAIMKLFECCGWKRMFKLSDITSTAKLVRLCKAVKSAEYKPECKNRGEVKVTVLSC
jgi:hypothetical protein